MSSARNNGRPKQGPNRHAKGEGTTYRVPKDPKQPLKYWVAAIELPSPDGERHRVTRKRKTEGLAKEQLTKLKRERLKRGTVSTSTRTVTEWLTEWLDDWMDVRPKTAAGYRSSIKVHIIPSIGKKRLDQLAHTDVRKLHKDIISKGLSSSTALYAHNCLSSALKDAKREGYVEEIATDLAKKPRVAASSLNVMSAAEGIAVLRMTEHERLGSRWWAALLTGARQGELIGLEIDRVLPNALDLSWQLQRLSWQHGCGGTCDRKRGTDCPARTLNGPADWEHRHVTGGLWLARPKSDAGKRMLTLVEPLKTMVMRRIEVAGTEPNPHGFVWTADPKKDRHGRELPLDGTPLDPSPDSKAWDALLKRAGVTDVRLHDARHVTASLLNRAGVDQATRMAILGHSSPAMTQHYTDVDMGQQGAALTSMAAFLALDAPDVGTDNTKHATD